MSRQFAISSAFSIFVRRIAVPWSKPQLRNLIILGTALSRERSLPLRRLARAIVGPRQVHRHLDKRFRRFLGNPNLDLEGALEWLLREKPAQSRRVGLYGMSMGGAVAVITAARRPEFQAVVVESAYSSATRSVIRYAGLFHHVPAWAVPYTLWWTRLRLGFDPEVCAPEALIDKISPRPLFLLQGGADLRMPPSEGEALLAAAGEPKALWTVPGADHGGLWEKAGRTYEDRLSDFFKKTLSAD